MILTVLASHPVATDCVRKDGAEIRWQRSVHDDPARLHPAGSLSDVGGVHLHLQRFHLIHDLRLSGIHIRGAGFGGGCVHRGRRIMLMMMVMFIMVVMVVMFLSVRLGCGSSNEK